MFETAELGRSLPKETYEAELPALRARLMQAQLALKESRSRVLVIISGVDGAGKAMVVHRLNEWLDPRGVNTHAFDEPTDEERQRPYFWRFWRAMPVRGRTAILYGSWYTEPIIGMVHETLKRAELDAAMRRIAAQEQMLAEDGVVFLKLWFHLSKEAQYRRLKDLEADPHRHWRVLPTDWKHHQLYETFIRAAGRMIRLTNRPHAPWQLIEATDDRFRDLTAGRLLLAAFEQALAMPSKSAAARSGRTAMPRLKVTPIGRARTILDQVDLTRSLTKGRYRKQLTARQALWNQLVWKAADAGVSNVIVFEGWDAAGKGSCIRRVTEAMDPRHYQIISVAAPTEEERAHHYLWRFWKWLPRDGRVTIFDRSWYGRVLVERVEKFATTAEWSRAYGEINDFEEQLCEHGIVLHKYWIHISKEEQLARFQKREKIDYKRYKITEEDWRNRKKWNAYKAAVNDMVAHTSTGNAPWTLVPGNDKRYARTFILKDLGRRLKRAIK
ncbi:MAG TPA: polyphosphate:AMP phosphotransferase [Verrucomicrobiales bacterium]|nr:polyphosphate:AMP phosphotransferase [Verrucomicrobiales bacterium]